MIGNDARRRDFDIVIAGGGMIGSSLALALAPLGLAVAVVEPVPRGVTAQPSFDDRSTAMSRSTRRMYEAMGLWPQIEAASTAIRRIHVSDRGRFGFAHIDAAEQGVDALGHVVINRVLGRVLQNALDGVETITAFNPARIVDVESNASHSTIAIEWADGRNEALTCRLLVAADGARSSVRDRLGIGASQVSYGQRAIVGNLLPSKPLDHCAYERFTASGPIAMLPMTDARAAFVWTLREREAERVLALEEHAFACELQDAFGTRVGRFSKIGKRSAYPLELSKALRLTANRAVLVGNAAHGLHPVAAQGFNLGMRDVAALCDCIADVYQSTGIDADIGATTMLQRYADWRRADQGKVVQITDGLVRLFADERRSIRILRDIGMLCFDMVPGVRSMFARTMMGLQGRLPRLSRGIPLGNP